MRRLMVFAFALGAATIARDASADSAGCVALAGVGTVNYNTTLATYAPANVFDAGETVTFDVVDSMGGGGGSIDVIVSGASGSSMVNLTFSGTAGEAGQAVFVITTSGSHQFSVDAFSLSGDVDVTFAGCSGGVDDADSGDGASSDAAALRQENARRDASRNTRVAISQQRSLVFQRTQQLAIRRPALRDAAPAGPGAAGQAGGAPFGVWGDIAVGGLEDRTASNRSQTKSAALVLGADTPLSDDFLVGAALTSGVIFGQDDADGDERFEADFGLLPYFAYQLDDRFSLQGAFGLSGAFGTAENAGVVGDTRAFRYFASLEASYFESWGDFSLYTGLSGLWGQGFQAAYTDERDQRFGSVQTRLGNMTLTLQPSYLIEWESQGGFIEPYVLTSYSYDLSQTKTAGAANDPDAFDVGVGMNLFFDDLSGTLEVSRTLGREDISATTGRVTVRIDF